MEGSPCRGIIFLVAAERACLRLGTGQAELVPGLGQAQDEAVDWPETRSAQQSEVESGHLTPKKC